MTCAGAMRDLLAPAAGRPAAGSEGGPADGDPCDSGGDGAGPPGPTVQRIVVTD